MAACDRRAIEDYRIPGLLLMENAGLQTVECVLETFGAAPESALVLCGKGNNGGDGLVIARHLSQAGCRVQIVLLAEGADLEGDAAANLEIVRALGLPLLELPEPEDWERRGPDPESFALVVDAMLGTGLRDGARGAPARAIEALDGCDRPIVAVDLPSGLSADSGVAPGAAVRADLTVTFAAPKVCHVLTPAADHCGELAVVDISIPTAVLDEARPALRIATAEDWEEVRPLRESTDHKGDHGRLLVVGGSVGMAGAVVLAARAALRCGAGLVHVGCPREVWPIVAGKLVEPLVHPVGEGAELRASDREAILELAAGMDAVALGPGIGTDEETVRLVRGLAVELECPLVIDADGLNGLAGELDRLSEARGPRVLTPHPGEAARLLESDIEEIQRDRPAALRRLVERSAAVVVLKGSRTLIGAPGRVPVVNPTGNPGLASGGTGDVLTGAVASLVAQGVEPWEAAWAGAWIHGRAGDRAARQTGQAGLVARDVVNALPAALRGDDGDPE